MKMDASLPPSSPTVSSSALDSVNAIGLAIIVTLYVIQGLFAFLNAAKSADDSPSLLTELFRGVKASTATWTSFGLIFIFPHLISWAALGSSAAAGHDNSFIYTGSLGTLIILITMELSLMQTMKPGDEGTWKGLLSFALALDILSILFLAWPIKTRALLGGLAEWQSVEQKILLLVVFAFVSSSLIVLFAKKAGDP